MSGNLLLTKQEPLKIPNTVTIISTYKKAKITPPDIYIDVSFMINEFEWAMNGTEPFIKNTLYSIYEPFYISLAETISLMRLESGLIVVLVCEAGQHRSVASAELLGRELENKNIPVRVKHEGLEKWFKF